MVSAAVGLLVPGWLESANAAAPPRKPARPQPKAPAKAPPKPAAPTPAEAAPAAPSADDLLFNALMEETVKQSPINNDMTIVWWLTDDFWRLALKSAPDLTPGQVEEAVSLLGTYTILMAAEGRLVDTSAVYQPVGEVRKALSVVMPDGRTLKPLAPEQVGETAVAISVAMKPVLAENLGPLGKNVNVFFFPAKDAEGRRLLDPRGKGFFTVMLRGREMKWRLPLSALVPRRECPTCKESLSGAYSFCPYDGARLP